MSINMNNRKSKSTAIAQPHRNAVKQNSPYFLIAPIALSFIALSIVFLPAVADNQLNAVETCPYLNQVHQGVSMDPRQNQQKLLLISTDSKNQAFTRIGQNDRIVRF
jgi:hypothetical protein